MMGDCKANLEKQLKEGRRLNVLIAENLSKVKADASL